MKDLVKGLRFFIKSKGQQKVKLLRMCLLLIKFSFVAKYIPLKFYYRKYFGQTYPEQLDDLQPYLREMGHIIRIGNLLPWRVTCLAESLAMKKYLGEIGINIPIKLGVITAGGIRAHAWCLPQKKNDFSELKILR